VDRSPRATDEDRTDTEKAGFRRPFLLGCAGWLPLARFTAAAGASTVLKSAAGTKPWAKGGRSAAAGGAKKIIFTGRETFVCDRL